jgi:hypothetical protein
MLRSSAQVVEVELIDVTNLGKGHVRQMEHSHNQRCEYWWGRARSFCERGRAARGGGVGGERDPYAIVNM